MLLFLFLSYPFLDSLFAQYSLNKPERLQMIAKCSLAQDTVFKVHFVKGEELAVEGPPLARELVKGALILTGLGLPELYRNFGGVLFIDTVIAEGNWFTITPKDTFLFVEAKLKIENWLIKEARIRAQGQDIQGKITYESGLPVNIAVEADSLKYTIEHKYKDGIPSRTEITASGKYIVITYKEVEL